MLTAPTRRCFPCAWHLVVSRAGGALSIRPGSRLGLCPRAGAHLARCWALHLHHILTTTLPGRRRYPTDNLPEPHSQEVAGSVDIFLASNPILHPHFPSQMSVPGEEGTRVPPDPAGGQSSRLPCAHVGCQETASVCLHEGIC